MIYAAKQMANPSKWVQADSSPVEVELETGVVCFNQEGCNLVGFSSFYPGLLGVFFFFFFFPMVPWSGPWVGGGDWTLLDSCHSMEKPLIA